MQTGNTIEILFWIMIIYIAYAYIRNRVRSAMRQIKVEQQVRESIRQSIQKRKLDRLYGRDRD